MICDKDRIAMRRGTMTAGMDLAQVAQAREAMAALACSIPDPAPPVALLPWRTAVLAGLLVGSLVWLFSA
tara:strand:- start:863 stop:1072 length:210 start_codon:yes stop_codon:yes gene_type:complete